MAKKKSHDADDDDDDDFLKDDDDTDDDGEEYDELSDREQYAEEYGDYALEQLDELLGDFPELDEYLDDDFAAMDDEDFYEGGK
jgi:hypothetical protein